MDFLKAQAQRIGEQLAGLTPSQKMLAGSLVVIMLMTLLGWSRFASTAEMVDVLPQDFSLEEISAVSTQLTAKGIPNHVNGARIQVPAERRTEALAHLTFERLLPRDTSMGFDEVIKNMDSPWNPDKKQDVVYNRALEMHLAQIMRQWPDVRSAMLSINAKTRRAFGDANIAPSASVNIQTKNPGDKAPKRLINAAADTVAAAVAGMDRSKVVVVIDGASYTVQPKDDAYLSDTWMDLLKEGERYFSQKIQSHLGYINGVMVSVTVDPKTTSSHFEKEHFEKSTTFDRAVDVKESTTEETSNSRPPAEPGAVPNVGANQSLQIGGPAAGGGEGTTKTQTDTTTKMQVFPSVVREWMKSPAGSAAVIGCSVNVPRSHFVRMFKDANPSAKDPDQTALQPLIDAELLRIKNSVTGCVSLTDPEKIQVNWYPDYMPLPADVAAQPAVASSIPLALTGHFKEIALGLLAVFSLFMVSMMVKKTTPTPIPAPARPEPRPAPGPIPQEEYIAGEATEANNSMDAMEIDDESIRTQQVINQVQDMVKENPDAAANLVKRWLSRT
jgi:flagellar biosynthesis/type III secretory pathway M-ring protein FliF/YscJ